MLALAAEALLLALATSASAYAGALPPARRLIHCTGVGRRNECAGKRLYLRHPAFAMSRSLNFWILPVDVFGTSPKITSFGHL